MQSIFRRQEIKFVLDTEKLEPLHSAMTEKIPPDKFPQYLVQSIYFDTPNWDIIRMSIEKPVYKEKLRLRCYGVPGEDTEMYLELKKKYRGVVNKRRIAFPMQELNKKTAKEIAADDETQIGRELDYYLQNHAVEERVHISYNRHAFAGEDGLRITLDTDIRFRTTTLDYQNPGEGLEVLPQDLTVMEIKTLGGMPMWLAKALSEYEIFPRSFSKYGAGYRKFIKGGNQALMSPQNIEGGSF